MAHDVLISYSTHDKPQADAICNRLESQGIRCWIAPRDVPLGSEYADSIVRAIEISQVMVLVYSAHADKSQHVRREAECAVKNSITIIPVRLEEAEMSEAFQYYMSQLHWLDAITPPLEQHIDKLAHDLHALLSQRAAVRAAAESGLGAQASVAAAGLVPEVHRPAATPLPAAPEAGPGGPTAPGQRTKQRSTVVAAVGAAVVAAVAAAGYFLLPSATPSPPWPMGAVVAPAALTPQAPVAVAAEAASAALVPVTVAPTQAAANTAAPPAPVTIPAVAHMSMYAAKRLLDKAGLSVKAVALEHPTLDYPQAIRTEPSAGQAAPASGEVTLYYSGMRTVPGLAGMTAGEARLKLDQLGFKVALKTKAGPQAEGTVLGMQPPPGSALLRGKVVTLEVAGPKVGVPDVSGQPIAEAKKLLAAAGLPGTDEPVWQQDAKLGSVIRTVPAAGQQLNPGDRLTLEVATAGGWVYVPGGRVAKVGQTLVMPRAGNLRVGPDNNSRQIGVAPRGKTVKVTNAYGRGWAQVVVLD